LNTQQTESVTSKGCSADFIGIHKSHNILSHISEIERRVLVRIAKVSGVNKPDISVVQELDFVIQSPGADDITLLSESTKNSVQFEAGSQSSGKKMRLGRSSKFPLR